MTSPLFSRCWLPLLAALLTVLPGRAQNLLTNPDFESGNTGFTSQYTYVATPAGNSTAGRYALVTDSKTFNTAFGSFGDHTTGSGQYLIADGATSATTILWEQTVTGLTPNQNYQFSFWLLNAINTNRAQIQVSANGTDVGTSFTNPNDGGNWQLNTVTVNPGSGTQLILRLRNLRTATGGNDFGIDDVALTAPMANNQLTANNVTTAVISTSATTFPTQISPLRATITGPAGATVSYFTLLTIPASGTLRLGSNGPLLTAGQSLNATEAGQLFYTPASSTTQNLTFTYRVTDSNGNFSPSAATYTIPLVAPAPPANCGPAYGGGAPSSGLSANYYPGYFADNLNFFATTTPGLTRIDPQLNFGGSSWGNIVPPATGTATNPNQFSTRHRGSVYVPATGAYTFYLTSDDASFMWIDGNAFSPTVANAFINNGGLHGSRTVQNTVTLSAGLHNVLVYYGEDGGGDVLTLEYSSAAGAGISRQVVPNSALCAGQSALPPTATNVTNSPAMPSSNAATGIAALAGSDPNAGGSVTRYLIASLPAPASGILYLGQGGAPITLNQSLTAAEAATLSFDPEPGFTGNATFTFYAVNNAGISSNTPATYTIPVVGPVADVTTSLSGPATLGANLSSGTFTVTFTNNGPQPATQVTQTVRLPTGATMTAAQQAALPSTAGYDAATNTINFGTVPVLNSGTTNTYTFSFRSPATQGANTLVSNVGTTTSQGSNSAVDQFTLNVTVQAGNFFVTNDDSNEVPANTTKTGNIILNDANPQNLANNGFEVQLVGAGVSHGTLTLNANGSYSYTPVGGYLGPDTFTYRVRVPGASPEFSNISTVTLNVYDSNQVCTIGTGNNLVVNPSFTDGNTGFSSAYGYVVDDPATNRELVPEALYGVGAEAANYHPSFSGTGRNGVGDNFMIVNGSQNLSVVYQQIINVQPNTYYSFSAYANSVNGNSPAQLGFVINGKSTSNVTTLDGTRNYTQIADLWFSGSSTTAVFEIRDVNKATGGNDFGLDDIYFGTCTVGLTANDVNNRFMSNEAPATSIAALSATVTAGPALNSFIIQTLPNADAGVLFLDNVVVIPGQEIMLADAGKLFFDPKAAYVGTAQFTYTATDVSGAGSRNTATYSLPVGNQPLPVTLTGFEAQLSGRTDALLTWETAAELNNDHFEVERSLDGRTFGIITRVAGRGTTNQATRYAHTDAGVGARSTGLVYYRLRQVDRDGTATYSGIRTVTFRPDVTADITLYPNPATALTRLDMRLLPAGTYQVRVLDNVGREVLHLSAEGGAEPALDLHAVASGTYIVLVRAENGQQFTKRLVKE
ncbi:T9SS type A sorting domain-containing protein [Hymenobacter sp. NST-14]|uniref:Ig-like domain-containing protein n=1 Tax=Hymenobacter piscis TaxID=2839984 RepID=UPI001C021D6E|nr:Ig-like domain-containing protein [Hymenobacter piscis]MBT9393824.1 T9SS type A sorting domain-containing protein [Hymenobacter piscis]